MPSPTAPRRAWKPGSPTLEQRKQIAECQRKAAEFGTRQVKEARAAQEKRLAAERADADAKRKAAEVLRVESMQNLYASPETEQILHRPSKRGRVGVDPVPTTARPMFISHGDAAHGWRESYTDMALASGEAMPSFPTNSLCSDAFTTGATISMLDGAYGTNMMGGDAYWSTEAWRDIACKITMTEVKHPFHGTCDKVCDGGVGLKLINTGSFNAAMSVTHLQLPRFVFDAARDILGRDVPSSELVVRITRPDRDERGRYRYQDIRMCSGEAYNALYASLNNVGISIYSIAGYRGVREGHSALCYGAMYVMRRGEMDFYKVMQQCAHPPRAVEYACKITDLVYNASRASILFFDIKPGNILKVVDSDGYDFKLVDFDPAFFLIDSGRKRDWRSLMLLNLALLSAHVRNQWVSASSWFIEAAKPTLFQLMDWALRPESRHECAWLLGSRSVQVEHRPPKSYEDFELQRLLSCLCTNYFYGEKPRGFSWPPVSTLWKWQTSDQASLDSHWVNQMNLDSWPWAWTHKHHTPLIQQLVSFATHEPPRRG